MRLRVFHYFCKFLAAVLLCILSAWASGNHAPEDYAGQWLMKLGQRNFMLLTIRVIDGKISGSLHRPERFSSSGINFSQISSSLTDFPIARGSATDAGLHFVTQKPSDKADKKDKDEDEFDMTLRSNGQAFLKYSGIPMDALPLTKVTGAAPALATDFEHNRVYVQDDSDTPNDEMKKIFDEDQRVRQAPNINWGVVNKSDSERREGTRKLLAAGELHTGKDFERAAFVFQHGDTAEDYLIAHSLALIAVSKGDMSATWIATATLDRYLHNIGKQQIYGTQFLSQDNHWTQEPYNHDLISDILRHHLGVPSMAAQQEQLHALQNAANR